MSRNFGSTMDGIKSPCPRPDRPWLQTSVPTLVWAVKVDAVVVARFFHEQDARGFAKARYGDTAQVGKRLRSKYPKARREIAK